MFTDFVINDAGGLQGHGEVGATLSGMRFDTGMLRPFIDANGQPSVVVNTGKTKYNKQTRTYDPVYAKKTIQELKAQGIDSPVFNYATLRKDEWVKIDEAVVRTARTRLRAWADLMAANPVSGFNAMGKLTYEYQTMNDPGEAVVDMDGITDGRTDSPQYKLKSIPLPITHSDFWFSARAIAASRNGSTPVDTTMAEAAGRRVAEVIEQTTIGTATGTTFGPSSSSDTRYTGTSTIYGYTTVPTKISKTDLTSPTGSNPEAVKQDVIEMRETLYSYGYYGPFILYHSTAYDAFLDDDYFRTGGTSAVTTLRKRIESIEGVTAVRRLDYLTSGYQMILVQMTSEYAQAINGMDITTVQWESQGGMRRNFKVMAIQVPLLKQPYNGVSPVVHGTTS